MTLLRELEEKAPPLGRGGYQSREFSTHPADRSRMGNAYPKPTLIHVAMLPRPVSLLSDIGRKFEKTKQTFTDSGRSEYVCVSCEKPVEKNYEYCPHCGAETVEPVE